MLSIITDNLIIIVPLYTNIFKKSLKCSTNDISCGMLKPLLISVSLIIKFTYNLCSKQFCFLDLLEYYYERYDCLSHSLLHITYSPNTHGLCVSNVQKCLT